jgi:hypothetical protein
MKTIFNIVKQKRFYKKSESYIKEDDSSIKHLTSNNKRSKDKLRSIKEERDMSELNGDTTINEDRP